MLVANVARAHHFLIRLEGRALGFADDLESVTRLCAHLGAACELRAGSLPADPDADLARIRAADATRLPTEATLVRAVSALN